MPNREPTEGMRVGERLSGWWSKVFAQPRDIDPRAFTHHPNVPLACLGASGDALAWQPGTAIHPGVEVVTDLEEEYRILETLGEGEFAQVRLAIHKQSGYPVGPPSIRVPLTVSVCDQVCQDGGRRCRSDPGQPLEAGADPEGNSNLIRITALRGKHAIR